MAPICVAMGVLTRADIYPFARFCDGQARYNVLREMLKTKGGTTYVVKKPGSQEIQHVAEFPQAYEIRAYHQILLRYEAEFGMTPSSRSRIRVETNSAALAAIVTDQDNVESSLDFMKFWKAAQRRTKPSAS